MNRTLAIVFALCAWCVGPAVAGDTSPERDVTVLIRTAAGGSTMIGAGVVIDSDDGLTILTAAHVLVAGTTPEVRFLAGARLPVRSIEPVEGHDLALIRTGAPPGPIRIPLSGRPAVGEPLEIWGHPRGAPFVRSRALVLDIDPAVPAAHARFMLACPSCDTGDSGAGVFDDRGSLVGIVVRVVVDAAGNRYGVWFAEPIGPATAALRRS